METVEQDPLAVFAYALKAKETRRQYTAKLKVFFDFIELNGDFDKQAREFVKMAATDSNWALASFMQFLTYQKERATYGLRPDSIGENLLSILAKISGGDARVGLQTLKIAAKNAEEKDLKKITMEEIRPAVKSARKYKLSYILGKLNDHQRTIYEILKKSRAMKSGKLFEEYNKVSERNIEDRSYRNYMRRMKQLGLVREISSGRWKKYQILA